MARTTTDRRFAAMANAAVAFLVLLGASGAVYALLWWLDFRSLEHAPWILVRQPDAIPAINGFGEVSVGVLGIAITVVAIIVELAANRYTPRITELFVTDPVNIVVMSGFVLSSVVVVWVNLSLVHEPSLYPANMATVATVLMTTSLLAILPYFAYVFDFLSPTTVIQRIQVNGSRAFARLIVFPRRLDASRADVLTAVEQLGDIALNSVDKKDKPLAIASIGALSAMAHDHVRAKPQLPEPWFDSTPLLGDDQDFVAFHREIVTSLTAQHTWVEMKILRQYQAVFGESLNRLRDINHVVAIQTRRLGRFALEQGDRATALLCLKFLNTYMRAAVNARDVRTAYNLLNEYRLLAEHSLHAADDFLVIELAERIKYYAQFAFSVQLAFILETAAYDLCALLELASAKGSSAHERLLGLFLDLDREPEGGKIQEASLFGVRKAQIKLATHYLVVGNEPMARRIFTDMRSEKPQRLRTIRRSLEAVESAEYWEVSDRGLDFEWLPPERRAVLPTFFGWFDQA